MEMAKYRITARELRVLGYPESPAISVALEVAKKHYKKVDKQQVFDVLQQVLLHPDKFLADDILGKIAVKLIEPEEQELTTLTEGVRFKVYGASFVDGGALAQMETATKLPIAVAGALMPDAHQGYGLPIGGVLATDNAIIPYGVGVDIGCRMSMSILDIPVTFFEKQQQQFKRSLVEHTLFGAGNGFKGKKLTDHEILYHETFGITPYLRNLNDKAVAQLGTSGGGNHFVEWGTIEILQEDEQLNLSKGKYLALLSHSGSRGLGASIAGYYTKIAKEQLRLPREVGNLAWLDLNSEEGMEYWLAMHLAGDYAKACHDVIHSKLISAMGAQVLAKVENHHNFAWKERVYGKEAIVHRKGATPASNKELGIIPGSMTAPGFLVKGKGNPEALMSASHGAGRKMNRKTASESFTNHALKKMLNDHGVTLIGGGLDEAPGAYKDIHQVMKAQEDLVEVLGKFQPKIVRMADDGSKED